VQHLLAVVGNIATGKSTLVQGLARELHAPVEAERWFDNPFLLAAQRDPERYALAAETWFVTEAAAAQARLEALEGGILERPVQEHLDVFVEYRARRGQLAGSDVSALRHIGDGLRRALREPDLIVHLHAPPAELHRRVVARGRDVEQRLTPDALTSLDERYADFIAALDVPIMHLDTTEIDIRHADDLKEVLLRVREQLDRS
jgi:deoxyadenosine/deoxycytidine kinase